VTAPTNKDIPRGSVIVFDPELNISKPLATADFSGWKIASDGILYGVLGQKWVTGVQMNSGKHKWWRELGSAATGPISVIGDELFTGERDGWLNCLDRNSGKVKWRIKLSRYSYREVVKHKDQVFAVTAGQQLYALNANTGTVNWIFDGGFPDLLTIAVAAPPVIVQESVIFGISSGDLVGVNLITGKEIWRQSNDSVEGRFHDVIAQTVLAKQRRLLVARYDGRLVSYELTPSGLRFVWSEEFVNIAASTTLNDAGIVLVGGQSGDVSAVDTESGKKKWSKQIGVPITQFTQFGKDAVLATGSSGRITALSLKDGNIMWHDDLMGSVVGPILPWKQQLFVSTGYKNLYGYLQPKL
jgi:outer membrane protein assembly factor BamB